MTTAVAVTNGVGATTGRVAAYDAVAALMAGRSTPAVRLTVYADATGAHACVATVKLYPAADHGVST